MIVLDTNVLSEPLKPLPEPTVLDWLAQAATWDDSAVATISVHELLYGAQRLPAGRRRQRLLVGIEQMLGSAGSRLLDYDEHAARIHASLRATCDAAGRTLSVEDGMIAAICLEHRARLATRNIRDFTDLGIDLINPWTS